MQLLLATSNPHKIEEVQAILVPLNIEVISLDEYDVVPQEPVEDGETFEANARIKAIYYAQQLGCTCIADDSGLEVDALGGAPGVHSGRFASDEIDSFYGLQRTDRDAANNRKLLRLLVSVPAAQKTARFVCALCLADADGNVLAESRGTFEGVITDTPTGDNGFGYDPLLCLPDMNCTSAQLTPQDKNARSHRGNAARQMAEHLRRSASADLH